MPQQSNTHHTSLSSPLLMLSRCILVQYLSRRAAWLLCCLYQPPPQLNNLNQNNMKKHSISWLLKNSTFSVHSCASKNMLHTAGTALTCMHRSPTVCHCTVRYPIFASQIICSFISVFPSVVQNLFRDTSRKTTNNKLSLSEATYSILCKGRSLTEVAWEISSTDPKGSVLCCRDTGKASPVPIPSTVFPDYFPSFFRLTVLSIIYFVPFLFFFFNYCTITMQPCVIPTVEVGLHMQSIRYWVCGLVFVFSWFFIWFWVWLFCCQVFLGFGLFFLNNNAQLETATYLLNLL